MNENKIINQINNFIEEYPRVCIVLGSGLDNFTKQLKNNKILKYDDISGFLKTKVKGHSGQFVYGYINNVPILCAQGRFHYYEGHTFEDIGIIIKLFNYYNPEKIIITNSSGCLRLDWGIGDFMLVEKFIDFSFINSNQPQEYIMDKSLDKNLNIHTGTYTYTIGPTYETKAEINEIINLGGDAVGMSTFPEYLMCKKLGISPIIISCLTNYGAGLVKKEVLHEDVLKNADNVKLKFSSLIKKII
tara:strand:+ start:25436 stop:26170 length:735 start_codon:yes stop_codon:yes gene_type:complete